MQRIGLTIGIKPEHVDEYTEAHAAVPADVLAAMGAYHVRNFSIFHDGDRLFGYLEYHGEDFEADMARMGTDPAMQEWWEYTVPMQNLLPGSSEVYGWTPMTEVFHLG